MCWGCIYLRRDDELLQCVIRHRHLPSSSRSSTFGSRQSQARDAKGVGWKWMWMVTATPFTRPSRKAPRYADASSCQPNHTLNSTLYIDLVRTDTTLSLAKEGVCLRRSGSYRRAGRRASRPRRRPSPCPSPPRARTGTDPAPTHSRSPGQHQPSARRFRSCHDIVTAVWSQRGTSSC